MIYKLLVTVRSNVNKHAIEHYTRYLRLTNIKKLSNTERFIKALYYILIRDFFEFLTSNLLFVDQTKVKCSNYRKKNLINPNN